MPQAKCVLCNKKLKLHQRRPVNKQVAKYLRKNYLLETTQDDFICGKCFRPAYRPSKKSTVEMETTFLNTSNDNTCKSPPSVRLNIPSVSKSHSYCFICKKPGPKLLVVPSRLRTNAFLKHNVIITAESRCCPSHMSDSVNDFKPDVVLLNTAEHCFLNRTSILNILKNVRQHALTWSQNRMSFDNIDIFTDEDLTSLTGLNKEQFVHFHQSVQSNIKNTSARSSFTSLGLFLFKLRSGLPNKLLSTLFDISKSSVRRAILSVREALMIDFVPSNLGFSHVTRRDVITNHTRKLAQSLLSENDQQAIIVLDGTYIYIQKSNNFAFQRRSYSMHKGRPLVKPMVIVSTTGYFISILGPYFADTRNNDASILNHIIHKNIEDIKNWVDPEDIFVVDRGFRDSLELLSDIGIQAKMPAFMKRNEKQMPTEDSNTSRLVTKVRWVVEAAKARIKSWKYLCHILPTNQVPFIGDYVRIVCSISNRYLSCLNSTNENDDITASQMLDRLLKSNELQKYVESNNLEKRNISKWNSVDDFDLSDFPELNETMLRVLTLGTYQLKLSTSYIQEYIDGECNFQLFNESPGLIRVRLQSRHISSRSYLVWIQYDSDHVKAYYCKCKAGARTLDTCSHVAAVLWYLGLAIHTDNVAYGVQDWGRYLEDAADIPQSVDSSDSEGSTVEE